VIRPAVALALLLPAVGCLPDLTNPGCQTDQECLVVGDGWCRCSLLDGVGICLKSGCAAPLTVDTTQPVFDTKDVGGPSDSGPDVPAADPCLTARAGADDGCCPPTLQERHTDPDCAVISAAGAVQALARAPALNAAGELLLVHAAPAGNARVTRFDSSLSRVGDTHDLGVPLEQTRPPVALADGGFVITTTEQLVFYGAARSSPTTRVLGEGALPASAPIPMASGALLVVTSDGRLLEVSGSTELLVGTLSVASERAEVALDGAEHFLHVVSEGQLHGFDLQKAEVLAALPGEWTGSPALSADAVYAALAPASLGGAGRKGGQWTAFVASPAAGVSPHPPVVGRGEVTYVAASQEKRLTAIRWITGAPSVSWSIDNLADVPASSPLVGADDTVYVPLNNGRLTAVSEDGQFLWHFDLGGKPAGDLLFWAEGTTLLAAGGRLARIASGGPLPDHPWPRRRHDSASTAHAAAPSR
jgi:hypothetical protein